MQNQIVPLALKALRPRVLATAVTLFVSTFASFAIASDVTNDGCGGVMFRRLDKIDITPEQRTDLNHFLEAESNSLTGLRQESKAVVSEAYFNTAFTQFKGEIGQRIRLRDIPLGGTANWTDTVYSTPLRYSLQINGVTETRSIKLRIREYLVEELASGQNSRNSLTAHAKFVELKIQHPTFPDSVIKPRVLIGDEGIAKLLHGGLSDQELAQVRTESSARAANAGAVTSGMIVPFFDFLQRLPFAQAGFNRNYVAIRYQRASYQAQLVSTLGGPPIDLQITVDSDVSLRNGADGRLLAVYPHEARVIEVKVPVRYANFDPQDFAEFPGLRSVRDFIAQLHAHLLTGFEPNSGKFSNTIRLVEENQN